MEELKKAMKDDIKKATKDIHHLFDAYTNNRIESNGNNKIQEYKQALFNEIVNVIVSLKDEHTMNREQEMQNGKPKKCQIMIFLGFFVKQFVFGLKCDIIVLTSESLNFKYGGYDFE